MDMELELDNKLCISVLSVTCKCREIDLHIITRAISVEIQIDDFLKPKKVRKSKYFLIVLIVR